jgi:predicted peptidase
MNKGVGFLFICLVWATPCPSQTEIDGFVPRLYRDSDHAQMPYRLFVPRGYDRTDAYPLIVWLHGAGGAGTDNLRQISGDQVPGTRIWLRPEVQAEHPAFILVPQSRGFWSEGQERLSPPLALVLKIIDSLEKEFSIDRKRIYLAGQSSGGLGTWELICRAPDVFAAAVPLCSPPYSFSYTARLAKIPIWAFNGANEDPEILSLSRKMIAALRKLGGAVRYTEYAGVGHEVWEYAFKEPDLVDWLFAQHR